MPAGNVPKEISAPVNPKMSFKNNFAGILRLRSLFSATYSAIWSKFPVSPLLHPAPECKFSGFLTLLQC